MQRLRSSFSQPCICNSCGISRAPGTAVYILCMRGPDECDRSQSGRTRSARSAAFAAARSTSRGSARFADACEDLACVVGSIYTTTYRVRSCPAYSLQSALTMSNVGICVCILCCSKAIVMMIVGQVTQARRKLRRSNRYYWRRSCSFSVG
jgi:hypothetical protein